MKSYLSIGLNQVERSQDWRRAASLGMARFGVTLAYGSFNRSSICGDRQNLDCHVTLNLGISSAIKANDFIHPETHRPSGRYRANAVPT